MSEQRWYMYDMLADDFYMASPEPRFSSIVNGHFTKDWKPWKVTLDKPRHKTAGDFPAAGAMPPILTKRAVEALRPLLSECGVLPLDCPDEPLFALDPPIHEGALDRELSDIEWFHPEEPEIALAINRYVFRGEAVRSSTIFRLAEDPRYTIISQAFREAVEKHGLKGLHFWPLDATWKP